MSAVEIPRAVYDEAARVQELAVVAVFQIRTAMDALDKLTNTVDVLAGWADGVPGNDPSRVREFATACGLDQIPAIDVDPAANWSQAMAMLDVVNGWRVENGYAEIQPSSWRYAPAGKWADRLASEVRTQADMLSVMASAALHASLDNLAESMGAVMAVESEAVPA